MGPQLHTGPIDYVMTKGNWQPIDTRLVPSDDAGYTYENAAGAYTLPLPGNAGGPVEAVEGEDSVRFSLIGTLS